MSRRQRSLTNPAGPATWQRILDQAVAVLMDDGFDLFSVQRVLDGAGVSRATLYRYFADVDSLIEAALVEIFRMEADRHLALLAALVDDSPDLATFREGLLVAARRFATIPPVVRIHRVHTLVLASTRPALAAAVATVQESLNDGWERALTVAQGRGFVRTDLDVRAVALIIQSIGPGRILDDVAATHLGDARWAEAFFEVVDRTVLERPAPLR